MWITNGRRPTGCACWPTPAKARRTGTRSLIIVPMKTPGVVEAQKIDKIGMNASRHGADLLRRRAGAAALPHRRGGPWASSTRCSSSRKSGCGPRRAARMACSTASTDTIDYTRERKVFGAALARQPVGALQAGRTEDRGRGAARAGLPRLRAVRAGEDVTELASMAKLKAGRLMPRGDRRLPAVLGRHGLHLGQPGLARVPRRPAGLDRRRRRRGDARHHCEDHGHLPDRALSAAMTTSKVPDRQPRRDRVRVVRTARAGQPHGGRVLRRRPPRPHVRGADHAVRIGGNAAAPNAT